ncbi:MAG: MBL fold metallo-hydrolase [Candidatus Saccharimonadales bacterium]
MHIEIIKTASLGNRGYLIHDGSVAIAVDVQRDYERWLDKATELGVTISYVLETHMHNDYVTGGFMLSQKAKAQYIIPADSGQSFKATEASDGEKFTIGKLLVTAMHTPGHTLNHTSYLISDETLSAAFTGGGVLYGTVGRPDLNSKELTKPLTEAQYDSAQKLAGLLADTTQVFPTHGFGSFCSSAPGSGADTSTMADEKRTNLVYTTQNKQEFIDTIISGLSAYPSYYAHMGKLNQSGPGEMKLTPVEKLSQDMLKTMLAHDEWVIDIRDRKAYATNHPSGAAGFELADSFSSYVGWLIPWGDAITLVGDNPTDLITAQTQLGRIGMDDFIGHTTDNVSAYLAAADSRSYPVKNFSDLRAAAQDNPFVVDVRTPTEYQDERIPGSLNIPLYDLTAQIDDLPNDTVIWVHCASGYRASIGASLVDRSGRSAVLIDDDFSVASKLGLTEKDERGRQDT